MKFNNSRVAGTYRYNVWASTEGSLSWYFTQWSGARGGATFDKEDAGIDNVTWGPAFYIPPVLYSWWGTSDTNWSNAANWNPSGGPPGAQDSALIVSTATRMPTLTANVSISTLTINAGTATVTLGGYSMTVSSFTNAGNFLFSGTETVKSAPNNLAGSTVTYNSGGSSIVLSTWTYRNLQINGANGTFTVVNSSIGVKENLTLAAGTLDASAS